jgi:hypothetical protein
MYTLRENMNEAIQYLDKDVSLVQLLSNISILYKSWNKKITNGTRQKNKTIKKSKS